MVTPSLFISLLSFAAHVVRVFDIGGESTQFGCCEHVNHQSLYRNKAVELGDWGCNSSQLSSHRCGLSVRTRYFIIVPLPMHCEVRMRQHYLDQTPISEVSDPINVTMSKACWCDHGRLSLSIYRGYPTWVSRKHARAAPAHCRTRLQSTPPHHGPPRWSCWQAAGANSPGSSDRPSN